MSKSPPVEHLLALLGQAVDFIEAPEPACSCHISPPCSDCVEHGYPGELVSEIKQVLTYKPDYTPLGRLFGEHAELSEKTLKLDAFLSSVSSRGMPQKHTDLLDKQFKGMGLYLLALSERIEVMIEDRATIGESIEETTALHGNSSIDPAGQKQEPSAMHGDINKLAIELAEITQKWHSQRMQTIAEMIDSDAESITLKGGSSQAELAGERLRGFRIGLIVAKGLFEKLPFNLSQEEGDEDE